MKREGHPVTTELQTAYAVTSAAYAQQLRQRIVALPESPDFWPEIIDHLLKRLRQSTEEDMLVNPWTCSSNWLRASRLLRVWCSKPDDRRLESTGAIRACSGRVHGARPLVPIVDATGE